MPTCRRLSVLMLLCFTFFAASSTPAQPATSAVKKAVSKIDKRIDYRQKLLWKSQTVVRFWKTQGRWALHKRYDNCNEVLGLGRVRVCKLARESQVRHAERIVALQRVIAELEERKQELLLPTGNQAHWRCIQRYEGAWDDPNAPYWGGLQMDWSFMSSYGPPALGYPNWPALLKAKGTADKWTPREQMAVAEYARSSGRGYYPWPNTARFCGLI